MTSTEAFLFRKVRLYILLFETPPITTWPKRIYSGSQCMVRQLSIHLEVYLRRLRAILHDPDSYPDPEIFKPERFLNEDGTVRDDPALSLVFGVGKRVCPGRHFVDATLFIVASSVLSAFNVTKAKDENGNEISVKAAVTVLSGIVV
jgi:Cytochrome P450